MAAAVAAWPVGERSPASGAGVRFRVICVKPHEQQSATAGRRRFTDYVA